ncbi:glucokinase [Roseovarius autotrophicus]|uniref:glucokinase n=1 Tax=Roseovarius autotrophicus TaxID=2824121 RepID=UPI0019DEF883|nr:glucokinase [Roseovarius autotrophicus]MBE0452776.1 glucokinase [Roseovarius sp.]
MAEWLLADVGASHTRLALATPEGLCSGTAARVENAAYDGFGAVVAAYLDGRKAAAVCAGVAGPVRGGAARLTNLDWVIDRAEVAHTSGAARVHLMNDLQAQAHALDDLAVSACVPILPGEADRGGPRMVMGLGTGSNIAVAHRVAGRLFVPPAEAGHSSLPHMSEALNRMIASVAQEAAHKPYEALLSGPGLARLHRLRMGVETSAPAIVAAFEAGDAEAHATLALFTRLLGVVMGNLALTHMATGGTYLIGSVARALAPHLAGLGLAESFTAKGPYAEIMGLIPVTLITDDTAALLGCWRALRQGDT